MPVAAERQTRGVVVSSIAPWVAPMLALLVACSDDTTARIDPDAGTDPDGGTVVEQPALQIKPPAVDLAPLEEATYCFYFRTSNTSDLVIRKWDSVLPPGAHDATVYLTNTDLEKPNTLSARPCGIKTNGNSLRWVYAAQDTGDPKNALVFPDDDGEGNHVGFPLAASRSGFVQIHFVNPNNAPLSAQIEINAYTYHDNKLVTPAGAFMTYNTAIDLATGSPTAPTTGTVSGNCKVRADWKFFAMATHTYRQGVESKILDGATALVTTSNWERAGMTTWGPEFYSFKGGSLSYQCAFKNVSNRRIVTGDTAATDETCMAIGYFFPSPDGAGGYCEDKTTIAPSPL